VSNESEMEELLARMEQLEVSMRETQTENQRLRDEMAQNEARYLAEAASRSDSPPGRAGSPDGATPTTGRRAADAAARARSFPRVEGVVDTRMLNKPEEFSGKDSDWPKFSLLLRAYVGAVSPRMYELMKIAEDVGRSIDRVDLDPGDDALDTQLYYILTMLTKEAGLDKVQLVECGEGLALWRLMVMEYEPNWKSRKTAMYQNILNYQIGDDPVVGLDIFDKLVRQYRIATKKEIDDDTRSGVILRALSSNPRHDDLARHIILNTHRLETYDLIKNEIREVLGTQKYLHRDNGSVQAVAKGKGKGKNTVEGQVTIKFQGECFICGKKGHKQADCYQNKSGARAKAKAKPKAKAAPFTGTCDHCGVKGHKKVECRKLKAEVAAGVGDGDRKRRRTDISSLEEQIAALAQQVQNIASDESVGSVGLSSIETKRGEIMAVASATKRVTLGLDSGAEITVWPPDLIPEVKTVPSPESIRGVKYYGPGDTSAPSLPNMGRRRYELDIGGLRRHANVHVVPVRKPLLAMCDLEDHGHDIYIVNGRRWAQHRETGEIIDIKRRGGRYEIDVEVVTPSDEPGNVPGRAWQ